MASIGQLQNLERLRKEGWVDLWHLRPYDHEEYARRHPEYKQYIGLRSENFYFGANIGYVSMMMLRIHGQEDRFCRIVDKDVIPVTREQVLEYEYVIPENKE